MFRIDARTRKVEQTKHEGKKNKKTIWLKNTNHKLVNLLLAKLQPNTFNVYLFI